MKPGEMVKVGRANVTQEPVHELEIALGCARSFSVSILGARGTRFVGLRTDGSTVCSCLTPDCEHQAAVRRALDNEAAALAAAAMFS